MAKRKKTHYRHIRFFDKYLKDFKYSEPEFDVVKTTNSRKIVTDTTNILFNSDGNTDIRLLNLINNVRADAARYLQLHPVISDEYFDYYGLLDTPVVGEIICKVDLSAAYWTYALQKTIITQKTHEKFLTLYESAPIEEAKDARLTALGSLSTEKYHKKYKLNQELGYCTIIDEFSTVEPTKDLYIDINRGIDWLMRESGNVVRGAFYYYWDCLFVKKEFAQEAVDFFHSRGFKVGIKETRLEFVEIAGRGYLIAEDGESKEPKIYMCRREDGHLLEGLV